MNSARAIEETVEAALLRHAADGARLCVALSGGVDSVVLLEALSKLRARLGFRLSAMHVHHGLSANADQWAVFCERLCGSRDVPLNVVRVLVDRGAAGGVEALARAERYRAFAGCDADFILLAQHADDQAETVLHQMLRGTGLKGLAGMGETRKLRDGLSLLRPLLDVSREEIEAVARAASLEWIEDESNLDTAYTRNFLRREILPALAARFPHYRDSLARTAKHAAEADSMMSALAAIDLEWNGKEARADLLDTLPPQRQVNALYHWLQWQWPSAQSFPFPSQAQLGEWAQQLFRPAPQDRPHQAGGHDFLIRRRKNLLFLDWK